MPAARQRSPITLHRIGRHGDDRNVSRRSLALADLGRGTEAVKLGHLAVHQHELIEVIRETGDRLDRLEAVVTTSTRHPSFSSIRTATFWLTALSSANRTRVRACADSSFSRVG